MPFGFNTLTSPEQEAAAASGNDQPPDQPKTLRTFKPSDMPMGRIMAAVMRSAAAVQGQEQAKSTKAAQDDGNSRMTVTLKPNPVGGEPLVTVKDAPASLLNGTQQSDLQQSYNTPKEQVEKKINATNMGAPPTAAPPADHPLEQAAAALEANGISVVRPWDKSIRDSLGNEQALIDMAKRLGIPNAERNARESYSRIKSGKLSKDVAAANLAKIAAGNIEQQSHNLQATLAQYQEAKTREKINQDRIEDNARLLRSQQDTEREKVLKHKQEIIDKTDFSLVDPKEWRATMDAQNGSGVPFTEFEYRRGEQKATQDTQKAFKDFTSNSEKYALGDYPSWEKAKIAFGHQLTPQQDQQGRATWEAARNLVNRKQRESDTQFQLREARLDRIRQQIEKATEEKPVSIGRSDLDLMSSAELVASDPAKVKNFDSALEQKQGLLQKEIKKAQRKLDDARVESRAILGTPETERRYGWREGLAHANLDSKEANDDIQSFQAELDAITAKRAERLAGAPSVPHQAVANARYTPQVEAGIDAYMKTAKVGRAKAIEALKAAGRLK